MKKKVTYYVFADYEKVFECKTKKTAEKKALEYLDTLLYSHVEIGKLTIG